MEISVVRNRLLQAMERSRAKAQQRRQRSGEAERAYAVFLEKIATPVVRMMASALKAEGYPFTVATPSGSVRLASDHGRDDFVELFLDTSGDEALVIGRVSRARGSRMLTGERPLKPGTGPDQLTDEDVLAFLVESLEPWFER